MILTYHSKERTGAWEEKQRSGVKGEGEQYDIDIRRGRKRKGKERRIEGREKSQKKSEEKGEREGKKRRGMERKTKRSLNISEYVLGSWMESRK